MKQTLKLLLCICLLLCMLLPHAYATDTQATDAQSTDAQTTDTQQATTEQPAFTQTTMPERATYTFINAGMGYGSGSLEVVMPQQSNATSFALYWGDAYCMRLPDYKPFMTGQITATTTYQSTTDSFSIPAEAKTVLIYTYSEQFGESTVPFKAKTTADGASGHINFTLPETGDLIAELVIVSDLHIGTNQTADKNLTAMLNDVVKTSPNAAGILVAGDAVDAAEESYYQKLQQLWQSVPNAPAMYLGVGDYGYRTAGTYAYDAVNFQNNLKLFLKYAGHPKGEALDKPYYSYSLSGVLLVFIGADSYLDGNAVYSQEQLTWLDGVLDNAGKYDAVLVIMHEPLPNTVSGSLDAQGYGNVYNAQAVKDVLKKYNNVSVFNGHTHWDMEADRTMMYLSGGTHLYNTAGVASLWNEQDGKGYQVAGSQGYYVTVYEDAILIRGRDFTTGEWISSACYTFSLVPSTVQQQTTPATTAKPSTTTKPVEEESTEEEEPGLLEELGTPLCILAGMMVIVFIVVFYKPKETQE